MEKRNYALIQMHFYKQQQINCPLKRDKTLVILSADKNNISVLIRFGWVFLRGAAIQVRASAS